jgi:hypothetical protein
VPIGSAVTALFVPVRLNLHVVASDFSGNLWYTSRSPGGVWQPAFLRIQDVVTGGPSGGFGGVCCGSDGQNVDVIGVGNDGNLWHTVRRVDGSWQTPFALVGRGSFSIQAVGCAYNSAGFQVVAANSGCTATYYTFRRPDGTWSDLLQIPGPALNRVSCTSRLSGSTLHVMGVGTNDGQLYYGYRRAADGSWQSPQLLSLTDGANGYGNVCCAEGPGHGLFALVNAVPAALKFTVGKSTGWDPLRPCAASFPGVLNTISCAETGLLTVHFVGISYLGMWHAALDGEGWEPSFDNVTSSGAPTAGFSFGVIGCVTTV